jgi:hypothetical protein
LCFINEGGRSNALPFSQIARVWLFCAHREKGIISLVYDGPTVFCCELKFSGGKRITLTNENANDDAYRAFVELLHDRLGRTRSRPRFRAGLSCFRFLAWLFFCGPAPPVRIEAWLFLFLLAEDRALLRRNFPRRYRPDRIPEGLLPDVGTISPT